MSGIDDISKPAIGSIMPQRIRSLPNSAENPRNVKSTTKVVLDTTELSEMGRDLSQTPGKTVNAEASTTADDTAGLEVSLSQEETNNLTQETTEQPQQITGGTSTQQVSNTYLENSGEDPLNRLQQLMSKLAEDLSPSDDTTPPT